jgi:hypothetical protein
MQKTFLNLTFFLKEMEEIFSELNQFPNRFMNLTINHILPTSQLGIMQVHPQD